MAFDSATWTTPETSPHPTERPRDVVPRCCTLDGFTNEVSRADGIGLTDVDAFTTLVVQTENSVYRLEIHGEPIFPMAKPGSDEAASSRG